MLAIPASTLSFPNSLTPAARTLILAAATAIGLAAFRVKATSVRLFSWSAVPLCRARHASARTDAAAIVGSNAGVSAAVSGQGQVSGDEGSSSLALRGDYRPQRSPRMYRHRTRNESGVLASDDVEYFPVWKESLRLHLRQTQGQLSFVRAPFWPSIRWSWSSPAVYFAITLLLLVRLVVGLVFSHRLVRTSQPIREQRVDQAARVPRAGERNRVCAARCRIRTDFRAGYRRRISLHDPAA